MKVIWTKYALESLSKIYKYYEQIAKVKVASNIRNQLFYSTKQLEKFPLSGPVEEFFIELDEEHRFITRGNYKIIYKIMNSKIYITDIFDTRQNPEELKFRNK